MQDDDMTIEMSFFRRMVVCGPRKQSAHCYNYSGKTILSVRCNSVNIVI